GLLLFLLLAAGLAWQVRRIPWRGVGLLLLVALPWLGFAFAYFGSPIPTSFIAKIYVYSHGMTTSRALILDAFATQFTSGWFQRAVTLLFMVGAARILADLTPRPPSLMRFAGKGVSGASSVEPGLKNPLEGKDRLQENVQDWVTPFPSEERAGREGGRGVRSLGLPLLWLLIYYGTMLASRVPAFPWYFLPPWPLFLGIAALGGDGIVRLIGRRLPASAALRRAWPMALLAFGLLGLAHLRSVRADIARAQWQEDTLRVPMGLWLCAHARPKERILLEPIGYVGYYSQRPILDMIGLVSPEVFVSYRQPDFLADMVRRFRPEWLCLRPSEVRAITLHDSALLAAQYDYIREFHVPGRGPDFLLYHRRQDSAP
ncbi:MAG TPA: hypothetical protein VFB21_15225, partial [Chthonomonadaceae bacterium]|nr:hypothetical protein [Chthonomonadaceae bacterium]